MKRKTKQEKQKEIDENMGDLLRQQRDRNEGKKKEVSSVSLQT